MMATAMTAPDAYLQSGSSPPIKADATFVAYDMDTAVKGLLSTKIQGLPFVEQVAAMSNAELIPLGEKALHDIADNIIVLTEIRRRFGNKQGTVHSAILGYQCWKDFVEKNSWYSLRTVQRRLNEVNGKDETKVNDRFKNAAPSVEDIMAAAKAEWEKAQMPEFDQPDAPEPYATIIFRCETEKDLKALAKATRQKLTQKTKSAWFPAKSHWAKQRAM